MAGAPKPQNPREYNRKMDEFAKALSDMFGVPMPPHVLKEMVRHVVKDHPKNG